MSVTRQAKELSAMDRGRTVAGYDAEGTYFSGELVGGDYNPGATLNLRIGRQQVEVLLDQPLTITGKQVDP